MHEGGLFLCSDHQKITFNLLVNFQGVFKQIVFFQYTFEMMTTSNIRYWEIFMRIWIDC